MKRLLVIFLFIFFIPQAASASLGTNLSGIDYWNGAAPLSNLVSQGGEWIDARPLASNKNGWPTKLSSPVRMAIAEGRYPAGTYKVEWQGFGRFLVAGKQFSGKNGRGNVYLDGQSLVLLEIQATDNLRNIRVFKSSALFRPEWLEMLRPYKTLRFMDWQKTNYSKPLSCKNAPGINYISQGRELGASTALQVRLANRLRANPWFTVPHLAGESWLRCQARMVKKNLRAGLIPRYEYSNETWNPAFEQFHFFFEKGGEVDPEDPFRGLQRLIGERHEWMRKIVGQEMRGRKWRSVLAGQAANSWVLEERLKWARADEIAIAPYMHLPGVNPFDPAEALEISSWSKDKLFDQLRRGLEEEVRPWIQSHLELGPRVIAYEGGQHLAGDSSNQALTDLFISAQTDPRMGELYKDYLNIWGRNLFVHYTDCGVYSEWGSWGALQFPEDKTSFKYAALKNHFS